MENNSRTDVKQGGDQNLPAEQKVSPKSNRPLLIIIGIFIVLVILVFALHKQISINWITDYDQAVQMARQQNKPMLLAFYKPNEPMVTDTFNNTYNDPDVKQFVEANFIPVLINVDEQPDLTREFHVNYYPTHYVKNPDSEKLFGPRLGWDPPILFIEEMTKLLNRSKQSTR
jgi:hypothetical protein